MEISDQLETLFSVEIESQEGSSVIEIPEQELRLGEIEEGETYRVAILPSPSTPESNETDSDPEPDQRRESSQPEPPVEEGETRDVEIEDIGDQGDGVARVERGFVVIVPDAEMGERVTVEITDVRDTVAFAEVTERLSYYE